jgi:hypothetical protein
MRWPTPFGKEMGIDFEVVVLCRIVILHGLGDVVKQGWLYPMMKVYGVNWKANVITIWCVANV